MRWTDEQAAAITARGDVLLEASAGTGKTTTIVGRVLWWLGLDVGVRARTGERIPPCPHPCGLDRIAAVTFTEKAAYDLERKLREAIDASERAAELRWQLDRASIGTIHAFCAELLRDHAMRLGIDPTFRILDERETRLRQDEVVREVLLDALSARGAGEVEREAAAVELVKRFTLYGFGHRKGAIDHVRDVLHDLRWRPHRWEAWARRPDAAAPPELDADRLRAIAERAGAWDAGREEADARAIADAGALYRLAAAALRRWLGWLEEENVRDFDSLVLDARRLLTRDETALAGVRDRYRTLIIDEFQDTDAAQKEIAFLIAGRADGAAAAGLPAEGAAGRSVATATGGSAAGPRPGPRLFLVGDPKQSIYRFRGADIAVWNDVRDRLAGDGELLRLSRNFRSAPRVVEFANRVCGRAMAECASALGAESPATRVEYQDLVPARAGRRTAAIEWLALDGPTRAAERRELEGRFVAARIRRLLGRTRIEDPETGELRPCASRDIAILGRKRDSLTALEPGLREWGIRFYNTATGGLADRQEVLDLVTALRLVDNPRDDLRAFAFLRSPFVGLRDEVLARIRLDPGAGHTYYLRQAERFLERVEAGEVEWPRAPESPRVAEVERSALREGLRAVRDAEALVERTDAAELLEDLLRRTGYREHLVLRDGAGEALANLERFVALLEEYRHLPLGSFLALWDRWGEKDLGVPQAALFSKDDDVVTLSTIHTAKGLEWPIVFLVDALEGPSERDRATDALHADPLLGPAFMPRQADRGARAERIAARGALEERAEEARLLYVALTRARDRLVISAPTGKREGYARWLGIELEEAVDEPEAEAWLGWDEEDEGLEAGFGGEGGSAAAEIEGGGLPQMDLFGARTEEPAVVGRILPAWRPLVVFRQPPSSQATISRVPISLAWLEGIEATEPPALARDVPSPERSFLTSATERMMRRADPGAWALRYRHGVVPAWRFAPDPAAGIPATLRGELIHGVLERIEAAEELASVLEETIAGIDAPDLENLLVEGRPYRVELEREIEGVVRGEQWAWYVEGESHRELRFLRLLGPTAWCQGAFDLLRPARAAAGGDARDAGDARGADHWIVDFKTHGIGAGEAEGTAREYRVQADVYREAVAALAGTEGRRVRTLFHFTHPNVHVELEPEV